MANSPPNAIFPHKPGSKVSRVFPTPDHTEPPHRGEEEIWQVQEGSAINRMSLSLFDQNYFFNYGKANRKFCSKKLAI